MFYGPARLSTSPKPWFLPKNRWTPTWLRSLLSKLFRSWEVINTSNCVHIFLPVFQIPVYFDVLSYLKKASCRGRLVLTVPWAVEYLSMMDPLAPLLDYFSMVLRWLSRKYRWIRFPGGVFGFFVAVVFFRVCRKKNSPLHFKRKVALFTTFYFEKINLTCSKVIFEKCFSFNEREKIISTVCYCITIYYKSLVLES